MSVTLEQIFNAPEHEILRISGNPDLFGIHAYIDVAEKYAESGDLIEADLYYMRDYHNSFVQKLVQLDTQPMVVYQVEQGTFNVMDRSKILMRAMREIKIHNSEIIIESINDLILKEKVDEAINIRKSYDVSETELYDGVDEQYQPIYYMETWFENQKNYIDYAKVYDLNDPGLLVNYDNTTDYDVLWMFYYFFQNPNIDSFSLVDNYFEIYNIPQNRYWYVYSLIVLYADHNGYTDEFIQKYILDHESDVEEAEKGDLVMLIFMTVVFNTLNGAMYKNLIYGYNSKYPDEQAEFNSALTYCIRDVFSNYRLNNFDTIYPEIDSPAYLDYGIYKNLLYNMYRHFEVDGVPPEILDRLIENTDYIEEVRRIIYSISPFTKRIL